MTAGDRDRDRDGDPAVDDILRSAAKRAAPPPAPDLLRRVAEMRPVRTRSRTGGFLLVLLAGVIWPVVTLASSPMRPDLGVLPLAWVIGGAALWGLGALATLAAALVPDRGEVLPSAARAARLGAASMLALLAFTALGTVSVPGVSRGLADVHASLLNSSLACGSHVFFVAAVFIVVGALRLRRVVPIGGRRIGMALGAAGGAVGGVALHFVCPIAVTAHVVLGHVGGMVLASLAGAALFSALVDR
jgi:hypothetical protein